MALICFDLDGTLADPLLAMQHCARLACEESGLPGPSVDQVTGCIGLGPEGLFAGLADPALLAQALASYWAHFAQDGIVKYRVYDGVLLMLARLKRQGHQLHVVTVKPVRYARQVLHHFDLLPNQETTHNNSKPLTNKPLTAAQRRLNPLQKRRMMNSVWSCRRGWTIIRRMW